jgi:hypothetical protein
MEDAVDEVAVGRRPHAGTFLLRIHGSGPIGTRWLAMADGRILLRCSPAASLAFRGNHGGDHEENEGAENEDLLAGRREVGETPASHVAGPQNGNRFGTHGGLKRGFKVAAQ